MFIQTHPAIRNLALGVVISIFLGSVSGGNAFSQETPSLKELYNLFLQQRNEIDILRKRAERAEKQLLQMQSKALPVGSNKLTPQIRKAAASSVKRPPSQDQKARPYVRAPIGAPKRKKSAWTVAAKVPVLNVASDALDVVKGDSDMHGSKFSGHADMDHLPGIDIRFNYALDDSQLSIGVGGKVWGQSATDNFFGVDVQNVIGLESDDLRGNGLRTRLTLLRAIGDFDVTYRVIEDEGLNLGLLAGLRAGYFESHHSVIVTVAGSSEYDPVGTRVGSKTKFYGGGPRLGVAANYDIGSGFGLDAKSSASFLIGAEDTRTDQSTESQDGTKSVTRVVPITDLEFALNYNNKFGPFETNFRIGAEVEWWSNVSDHFRSTSHTAPSSPSAKDYLFWGPFLQGSLTW